MRGGNESILQFVLDGRLGRVMHFSGVFETKEDMIIEQQDTVLRPAALFLQNVYDLQEKKTT